MNKNHCFIVFFFGDEVLLGRGFKYSLLSPLLGEMIQFDSYFSDGLKPPTRLASFSTRRWPLKDFWEFFT